MLQCRAGARRFRAFHQDVQSVGATGGVYKGQGRNHRELMTRDYEAFLVQDQELQESIPVTGHFSRLPGPVGQGRTRFVRQCSARAAQDI